MNLIEYPDRELMMLALADKVASQLRRALEVEDRVTLCVPGGTTPGPVFDILSGLDLDWARVWVMLNDERWVDETSPRSNTALLRNRLLRGAAALAHLVPLYAPAETPEDRLDELSRGVRAALPLTVLLLGMGADMHTASLFPGADRLAEALAPDAPPVMALRADAAGEPRITLTAPVLRAAMHCHLLITGAEKRAALERAASLPETEAPVRIVLSNATIHWAP
ncbi:6-phosphogluconolactonase [Rhodobacter capsulatus]|uniref:6-phosphogluconolactonase n=1 Tax=Rhodobacter capsulatus TaxID=1061 RepID=A0A1G7CJL4_RHOCA|nr:6-phosphogluconolactonase [Rhodobacter capsulatus]WER10702.1 6-phosphogluconolactonase [Rhodobacter capsulatus]SDE39431.1 6-phosphogluconolactonase [Rhodobacter capsulatus]